ncbi:MAG: ABC transporter substrate-binding protein [Alphaproteobacteria bacterium]|nr:ABC transporter substrate-binding protein [Alphaproteobacteria bacterium]
MVAAYGLSLQPLAAEVIKIGLILTYSGPAASLGEELDNGVKLYIKEHQADLPPGVTLEIVRRDDTGPNPDVAKRLAQELITREKVNILAGVVWTPCAAAIAPLTAEAKVPLVLMNASGPGIVRMSPYIARTSFTMSQESTPLGEWAAKQGNKRAYIIVSDYAPGAEAEDGFKRGFTQNGGEIVGSVHVPLKDPDFVPFVQHAKDAKPELLFVFVPAGKQATAIMKAYSDLGLGAAGVKVVGTQDLTPEEELPNMGDAPLGVITAGAYSEAAKRPANEAFVAAWKREYGANSHANFMAADAWDGTAAIFAAIKAQGGKIDPDKTMKLLAGWKDPDSPRGPIEIDAETRDIVQNIYIRKVERQGEGLANVEFETIPQVKDPWKILNPK